MQVFSDKTSGSLKSFAITAWAVNEMQFIISRKCKTFLAHSGHSEMAVFSAEAEKRDAMKYSVIEEPPESVYGYYTS